MMLAAWALGVGSCPATVYEPTLARQLLGYPEEMGCEYLLSFGYPAGSTAQVLVKSGASLSGNSAASVTVDGNDEVSGSATANGLCGLGSYTVYFDIRFS